MLELTRRQGEILNLIRKRIEKTGLPPTRAEICEHFGFTSPNAAEQHLRALAAKGVIEMLPGSSRGIRLVAQGARAPEFSLPVVGGSPPAGRSLRWSTLKTTFASTRASSSRAPTICCACAA